jgi:periplasmic protein TonB
MAKENDKKAEPLLMAAGTLALWIFCVAIGGTGLLISYARPRPLEKVAPVLNAELLNVELTEEPITSTPTPPKLDVAQPPPLNQPVVTPQAPPMLAVAEPSPQIAFAVPVAAPAKVVPASQASFRTVETPVLTAPPAPAAPAPQPLTFGQGEGKQPAPEYPRQSLREGQEGTVVVRLTVGENGRVMAADTASASPWPLLNDAALRVVRNRWRFAAGTLRAYEVAIRFTLSK